MASEQKLRILAIHGYRQSENIFRGKLGSLRKSFKQKIDFQFMRAPHTVPPLESTYEQEGLEAKGYGWWFNTQDFTFNATEPSTLSIGFEESLALIEETFKHCEPIDGILGFSQGAALVSILCSLQQKKLSPIKFDFAIIISGFKSLCEPHAIFYNEQLSLPTLHIYGETDRIIPTGMSSELAAVYDNKKVITHEGGHYVPGKKQIYDDFIDEMLASRKKVEKASNMG